MQATDVLMSEHRVIEMVLSCLEAITAQAEASGTLDAISAAQTLDFLRGFADRCHHGKEEKHLFPLLESRGMPREGGPTGVMLHEHVLGRQLLAEMAVAADRSSAMAFAVAARSYVRLLRDHIWKEDQRLFQMANHLLSEEDDARLMRAYATTEHEDMGEGTHERYLGIAKQLAERLGVAQYSIS
jgi:hemerythrin-like domain-containing protein